MYVCIYRYGLLLDRHGHQDSAEHMFRVVLSHDPDHADSLCALADLFSRVHTDADAAEHLYQRALRTAPGHVDALCSFAVLLSHDPARRSQASELMRRARALAPTHPRVVALVEVSGGESNAPRVVALADMSGGESDEDGQSNEEARLKASPGPHE